MVLTKRRLPADPAWNDERRRIEQLGLADVFKYRVDARIHFRLSLRLNRVREDRLREILGTLPPLPTTVELEAWCAAFEAAWDRVHRVELPESSSSDSLSAMDTIWEMRTDRERELLGEWRTRVEQAASANRFELCRRAVGEMRLSDIVDRKKEEDRDTSRRDLLQRCVHRRREIDAFVASTIKSARGWPPFQALHPAATLTSTLGALVREDALVADAELLERTLFVSPPGIGHVGAKRLENLTFEFMEELGFSPAVIEEAVRPLLPQFSARAVSGRIGKAAKRRS